MASKVSTSHTEKKKTKKMVTTILKEYYPCVKWTMRVKTARLVVRTINFNKGLSKVDCFNKALHVINTVYDEPIFFIQTNLDEYDIEHINNMFVLTEDTTHVSIGMCALPAPNNANSKDLFKLNMFGLKPPVPISI